MERLKFHSVAVLALFPIIITVIPGLSIAWDDETHIAISKASGYHKKIDEIIGHEVSDNLQKIKIYPISIHSEKDLAKEIARIANLSIKLGYRIQDERRLLTKNEAYAQISHRASLFKGILEYVRKIKWWLNNKKWIGQSPIESLTGKQGGNDGLPIQAKARSL
jgi:hypothetical protein